MKKIIILLVLIVLGVFAYVSLNPGKLPFIEKYIPQSITSSIRSLASSSEGELQAYVNTDPTSNIGAVIVGENDEKIVAFRENGKLDKLTIQTEDGAIGVVELNDQGLPETFTIGESVAMFTNYTDTTVDITISHPDGKTETFEQSNIMAMSPFQLIETAHALETQGVLHEAGIAFNVLTCGVALTSMFVSAGATSPVAFLGCGALAVRVSTWDVEIGPCKGDVIQCAGNMIIDGEAGDALVTVTEGIYDAFFPSGVELKGNFRNRITNTPITIGTLQARRKNSRESIRGEWNSNGSYELLFKNGGVYKMQTVAEGFQDASFGVMLSDAKAQIRIPGKAMMFEKELSKDSLQMIGMDFFIDPEGVIRGEVIDGVEGDSIENAKVVLLEDGNNVAKDFTANDGTFILEPPLNDKATSFMLEVSKKEYEDTTVPFFVSYEIKEQSDEYEIENWNGVVKMTPVEEVVVENKPDESEEKTDKKEGVGHHGAGGEGRGRVLMPTHSVAEGKLMQEAMMKCAKAGGRIFPKVKNGQYTDYCQINGEAKCTIFEYYRDTCR